MVSVHRFLRSARRFSFAVLVSLGLVLSWSAIGHAQLPSLQTTATDNLLNPPNGVTRLGEYEIARVQSPLDKKLLFEIASPTIFNREKPPERSLPVEIRAEEIHQRLWRAVHRTQMAKQPPTIVVARLNNRPILQLKDDRTQRPLQLVTVTEPDADYYGKSIDGLAQEWQGVLQAEVERIAQLLSPSVLGQRLWEALQLGLGLVLASGGFWLLWRGLVRREQAVRTRHQAATSAIEPPLINLLTDPVANEQTLTTREGKGMTIAQWRSQLLTLLHHQFTRDRQLELYSLLKWGMLWLFILMWYVGIVVIISRVPYLMRWSTEALAEPLGLLILWFFISLAIRISRYLIDQLVHAWATHLTESLGETQRVALRATTISGALKGLVAVIFNLLGLLWSLEIFDIPTGSILAGGAIIGLVISFSSQSLIKDLVNGCLILLEDQFAVGDVVQIGNKSGLVENLNLRVTQLRSAEGQLITIPNSIISDVCNLTRLWSRIDFAILVDYNNDPKHVLGVLQQVSEQMYSEPEWRDRLPELPDVLGIDDLSHNGMLIRIWIKTDPMEQWCVGREFRLRVRQAFEAAHIQIGRPQWITYTTGLESRSLQDGRSVP